ncbi:MAG: hypothetical protein WBI28_00305, partial [Candidatus Omnitrophota bacterium]
WLQRKKQDTKTSSPAASSRTSSEKIQSAIKEVNERIDNLITTAQRMVVLLSFPRKEINKVRFWRGLKERIEDNKVAIEVILIEEKLARISKGRAIKELQVYPGLLGESFQTAAENRIVSNFISSSPAVGSSLDRMIALFPNGYNWKELAKLGLKIEMKVSLDAFKPGLFVFLNTERLLTKGVFCYIDFTIDYQVSDSHKTGEISLLYNLEQEEKIIMYSLYPRLPPNRELGKTIVWLLLNIWPHWENRQIILDCAIRDGQRMAEGMLDMGVRAISEAYYRSFDECRDYEFSISPKNQEQQDAIAAFWRHVTRFVVTKDEQLAVIIEKAQKGEMNPKYTNSLLGVGQLLQRYSSSPSVSAKGDIRGYTRENKNRDSDHYFASSPVIRTTEVIGGIFIATIINAVPVNLMVCVVFGHTIYYKISLVLGIIVAGLFVISTLAAKLMSLMRKEEEAAVIETPDQKDTSSSPIRLKHIGYGIRNIFNVKHIIEVALVVGKDIVDGYEIVNFALFRLMGSLYVIQKYKDNKFVLSDLSESIDLEFIGGLVYTLMPGCKDWAISTNHYNRGLLKEYISPYPFYVEPEYRNLKLGKILMAKAVSEMKANNVKEYFYPQGIGNVYPIIKSLLGKSVSMDTWDIKNISIEKARRLVPSLLKKYGYKIIDFSVSSPIGNNAQLMLAEDIAKGKLSFEEGYIVIHISDEYIRLRFEELGKEFKYACLPRRFTFIANRLKNFFDSDKAMQVALAIEDYAPDAIRISEKTIRRWTKATQPSSVKVNTEKYTEGDATYLVISSSPLKAKEVLRKLAKAFIYSSLHSILGLIPPLLLVLVTILGLEYLFTSITVLFARVLLLKSIAF